MNALASQIVGNYISVSLTTSICYISQMTAHMYASLEKTKLLCLLMYKNT